MSEDRRTGAAGEDRRDPDVGSRKSLAVILLTGAICVLCFAARFAWAQTSMDLIRWREFSCARQSNQFGGRLTAVDDVQRGGFIVFGEGEFARLWSSTVHTTAPEGKEFCQGFVMYDFDDGSSILAKIDIAGEPKTKQVGTIVFLAGSKRFKGISGRGTISAWTPAKWDMYAEVEATYSVRPQ